MSAASRDAFSMTMSPPPPADLGSYARFMHQHTKRQMDAVSQSSTSPERRSGSQGSNQGSSGRQSSGTSAVPNGVASRGRNPSDYSYRP